MSDPSTFMRSGGHFVLFTQTEEAFFGCLPTIEEKVENAWFTTMNGGRFPAAFMDSEEQGWPSISGDCLLWRAVQTSSSDGARILRR